MKHTPYKYFNKIKKIELVLILIAVAFVSACSNMEPRQATIGSNKADFDEQSTAADEGKTTNPIAVAKLRPKASLKIMAVGDIMLGTDYPDYRLAANDGRELLKYVAPVLRQADITFGNLEATFGAAGKAEKACPDVRRCYVFRMPPRYVSYLVEAGFDVMSLANNHARDFGDSGRLLTMQTLDQAGIKHSGLEGDIARWQMKGLDIVLIGFAPFRGAHDFLDLDYVRHKITELSGQYDIVIVSFHAGAEGDKHTRVPFKTEYFHGENRGDVALFAHTAIDAGADLILGHGPHVPRALELYQGRLIAYSLGNFCTTLGINVAGKNGLAPILSVNINQDGEFEAGKIISARQIRPGGPQLDKRRRAARLIKQLTELDFPHTPLQIDAIGNISVKSMDSETKSDKPGPYSVK